MPTQRYKVKLILFQKDFFTRRRMVFNNINLFRINKLNYIPLRDVLEILEYDNYRATPQRIIVTDGSEFVSIPKIGTTGRREGVLFTVDRLIVINNLRYISLRSINRLFNVDLMFNVSKKHVYISQPGRYFITLRGDTLHSIAGLLNTSVTNLLSKNKNLREQITAGVKNLLSKNKNLREPIPAGVKLIIPTIDFDIMPVPNIKSNKLVKIKQRPELVPKIIALGKSLIGTPYKFGARPYPKSGKFDCSSYIQYIFGRNGVRLPRTSRSQARRGRFITQNKIEPGDLIFFRRSRYSDNRIGHVGMDIGNGRMLNTYKSPPGVTISRWKSTHWIRRYVTAREIL